MNKHERLSEVYQAAERIQFDNHSKLVFFSDVHRGDNSWADEFARNQAIYNYALEYYFGNDFTYIEVGDGDELMKNIGYRSIRIAHSPIYQLLKKFYAEGRFYYIYGNHDILYKIKENVRNALYKYYNLKTERVEPLFPGIDVHEGLVLEHQETGKDLFVTHGHQGEFINDRYWQISRFFLRYLWRPLQMLGLHNPIRVSRNPERKEDVEEELINWITEHGQPLLCGHTHDPHFPKTNEAPYFNSGSCVHPRHVTNIEIDNGEIMLVRWQVKPNQNGAMFVHREVIGGPENISVYLDKEEYQLDEPEEVLIPGGETAEKVSLTRQRKNPGE